MGHKKRNLILGGVSKCVRVIAGLTRNPILSLPNATRCVPTDLTG